MHNRFRETLESGGFVVTVEMIPGRGAKEASQEQAIENMKEIYDTGRVDAVSITDYPNGNPAIAPYAIAQDLWDAGIPSLVHYTCKDRNRNQIQGQFYAFQRDGLENLLLMTGDFPTSGYEGAARPVFDLDSVTIMTLVSRMNEGLLVETPKGVRREQPANFFAGSCVNPFKYRTGEIIPQYLKAEKKIIAGSRFLITQLGYDSAKLKELHTYIRSRGYDTPLIANIFLLSFRTAKMINEGGIPGCHIFDDLYRQLEEESKAPDKGRAARIERAAKMVAVARGIGYQGVHIGGVGVDAATVVEVLDRADELQPQWEDLFEQVRFGQPGGDYLYGDGCGPAADALVPKEDIRGRKLYRWYRLSRFFHYWILTPDKRLFGMLARLMDSADRRRGIDRPHRIEHSGKAFLYGCLDCGDCGLESAVYSCPMSQCPKSQRNGPCGGSEDGWCERNHGKKYCVWYMAYHRLDRYDEHWRMRSFITPPNKWTYRNTSAWSNYTHRRDNAAHRTPVSIGLDGAQGGLPTSSENE